MNKFKIGIQSKLVDIIKLSKDKNFVKSKAMNIFLNDSKIKIKAEILENDKYVKARWGDEIVKETSATDEEHFKRQEEFNLKVGISSYFKKYGNRDPGSGDLRIGKVMTFREDMYSLLFLTNLQDEYRKACED